MRRVIFWIVFALTLMLWLPRSVGAQQPGVTLQASALYNGTSKYGEWLPVVVEVGNSGADVRGRVQVQVSGTDNNAATYAQRLELPRGARKQVTIFVVPNNFSRRLQVEFLPEGTSEALVTTQVDVRPVPNIRFVAAAISAGGEGLEALAGTNFRGERQSDQAVLVPLTLATLPDRPEALRTLDMLILTGVDTSSLTPRQKAALEQYVVYGGMLVLGGGPEASRVLAGIPDSLRPVSLTGETFLDQLASLEELTGEPVRVAGPFDAAQGEPVDEAAVRVTEGETPLLVERVVGDGAVFWLALDPSLTPFDAWSGSEEFWLALVGSRALYPIEMAPDIAPRQGANNDLFYALQNLPSLDLPSLRLLVPLLGLYIFIVGPVNYFVLRRRRRLELAWLTIPVVTLLFSIGAYGLGYQLRGGDVILNQVALVQAIPGSDGAYIRSMIGVFSPSRQSYDLQVSGEALLSPSQVNYDPFSGVSSAPSNAVLVQGEPASIEGLTVNQWSMQSVMAETLATSGYGFDAEFKTADGKLVGTLTNNTRFGWQDVVVVLGSQFTRVGDIAPGATKEVNLSVPDGGNTGGPDIAWRIFESEFGPNGPNRETQVRQQILSSLYNGSMAMDPKNSLAGSRAPVLLAWLPAAPTEVSLGDDGRISNVATTLLYAEMTLEFGEGAVSLPRGTIGARFLSNDGSTCYGPGSASLSPDFSSAEVQFELPAGARDINPSELSLYISSDGGWFASPRLSLYDYEAEEWSEVTEPKLGRNRVREPDTFLSDNGTFRMRIENPERNRGGCLFFDASLEGTLGQAADVSTQ